MSEPQAPARIGWVVDAQVDFMDPDGRLYVHDLGDPTDPGARRIEGSLRDAVAWMRTHCDVVVFTGDWHGYDDEEIDPDAPDPAAGTYPPHCMGRSSHPEERAGAEIVASIRPADPVVLGVDATPDDARRTARSAVRDGREVFVRKTRFDVFEGNQATEAFLAALGEALGRPLTFVVAGVARDVCVTQAVDGLLARRYGVTALRDATWGLGLEAEDATLARWRGAGGRVVSVADLPRP